jgi:23S rRNA (guanine745-N1)-methyltransferase
VLADIMQYIECPKCGHALAEVDNVLRCEVGHAYDIARQGYVSMLRGDASIGTADTPAMVEARTTFLGSGYYSAIADAVAEAAADALADGAEGCIAEVGAGTGYYLSAVLDRLPERVGIALDISKAASKRAARAHERIGAVVCDAWDRLPMRDDTVAVLLDIFSPRNPAEFERVLVPGGSLVVVTPTPRHLGEIVQILGMLTVDDRKDERLETAFEGRFERVASVLVETQLELSRDDVAAVAGMGPSAWHVAEKRGARIAALSESTSVTLSVNVATYRQISLD